MADSIRLVVIRPGAWAAVCTTHPPILLTIIGDKKLNLTSSASSAQLTALLPSSKKLSLLACFFSALASSPSRPAGVFASPLQFFSVMFAKPQGMLNLLSAQNSPCLS